MSPDIHSVLDAALKLPLEQRRELINRIENANLKSEKTRGNVSRFFGTFDSGDSRAGDNDRIDFDLAASYLDTNRSPT